MYLMPIEREILTWRNDNPVLVVAIIIAIIVAFIIAYRLDRKNEQRRIGEDRKATRDYIKLRNKAYYERFGK